jgi:hypothetical protein
VCVLVNAHSVAQRRRLARSRCIVRKARTRPEETRLTEIATHIAGIAIERQQQQEILRERARINLAAESADLAFWILYPEQNSA